MDTLQPGEKILLRISNECEEGVRLDVFLAKHLQDFSRSRMKGLIHAGQVTLNQKKTKPRCLTTLGDEIEILLPEIKSTEILPENIPLSILYEDTALLVLDKPSGLVVHPAVGNTQGTLVNALLHHCQDLSGIGGVTRPGIVHRLDKDTSGCMVIAKTDSAHVNLSQQFADRRIGKTYLAAVQGHPQEKKGRIENRIGRHPINRLKMAVLPPPKGKLAITEYEVIATLEKNSLVQCQLLTGRTHQIRVHLKELGHPILGDVIYAKPHKQSLSVPRLLLHAWKLSFTHPETKETLSFQAEIPPPFLPFFNS